MAQQPDWESGLTADILAIVAKVGLEQGFGASGWTKAMRGVCEAWKEGFELGVTKVIIMSNGPPPRLSFSQCFPNLTNLNIGHCYMNCAGLSALVGLERLLSLTIGSPVGRAKEGQLARRITPGGLAHIRGLHLTSLDLSRCEKLFSIFKNGNDPLLHLQGMPLTMLSLEGCKVHTISSLQGLPLTDLNLASCKLGFWDTQTPGVTLEALGGMPLTRLNLRGYHGTLNLDGLRHLVGCPLTDLNLGSKWLGYKLGSSALLLLGEMPLKRLVLGGWMDDLTDEGIGHLRGLALERLHISTSEISDTGLAHLAGMPLVSLGLSFCDCLTMAGMQHLRGLPLERLNLCFKDEDGLVWYYEIGSEAVMGLVGDVLPSEVVITEDIEFVV